MIMSNDFKFHLEILKFVYGWWVKISPQHYINYQYNDNFRLNEFIKLMMTSILNFNILKD